MNAEHAHSIDRYANVLLGRGGSGWRMVGIDPDGCDLARGAARRTIEVDQNCAKLATAGGRTGKGKSRMGAPRPS
jgi:putative heme iron utilization protein